MSLFMLLSPLQFLKMITYDFVYRNLNLHFLVCQTDNFSYLKVTSNEAIQTAKLLGTKEGLLVSAIF